MIVIAVQIMFIMIDTLVPISIWTILPVVFSFIAAVGAPVATVLVKAIVLRSKEEILSLMEVKYVTKELFNTRMGTIDDKLRNINEDMRENRRDDNRREDIRRDEVRREEDRNREKNK